MAGKRPSKQAGGTNVQKWDEWDKQFHTSPAADLRWYSRLTYLSNGL